MIALSFIQFNISFSEERRVGPGLRTGLKEAWLDPITDRALLVVVLVALLVTDGLVVKGADTPAEDSLAVFHFPRLLLRLLRVVVPAESPLAVQWHGGMAESEGLL